MADSKSNLKKAVDGSPIHGRDRLSELLLCFLLLDAVDVVVDASGLLEGRDAAAHPGGAMGQLVVRGKDGPVHGILERDRPVDCADRDALDEGMRQTGSAVMSVGSVAVYMAVGLDGSGAVVGCNPRRGNLVNMSVINVPGELSVSVTTQTMFMVFLVPLHW